MSEPRHDSARTWRDAFAALPVEAPDAPRWPAIAAALDAPQRPRRARAGARWLALAAAAAALAVMPMAWRIQSPPATAPARQTAQPVPATPAADSRARLESLYAESARLEAVLALARDARVSSGPAAALSAEFDARLAVIDATLAQPGLPPEQRVTLWQARVEALREVAGFESTQRWLSANGRRFDGALVSID